MNMKRNVQREEGNKHQDGKIIKGQESNEDYEKYLHRAEKGYSIFGRIVWTVIGILITVSLMSIGGFFVTLGLITIISFIPYFIADARNHKDKKFILVLGICIFAGGIPWIIALFWAFSSKKS